MALSNFEELQLIDGTLSPPGTTLDALVHQSSASYGVEFYTNYNETALDGSVVDGELVYTNPEAAAYVNKMLSVSNQVFRASGVDIKRLTRIIVVLIGQAAPNIGVVQDATESQWDGFVSDNIDEAFEYYAGVRKDEKTAYLAL